MSGLTPFLAKSCLLAQTDWQPFFVNHAVKPRVCWGHTPPHIGRHCLLDVAAVISTNPLPSCPWGGGGGRGREPLYPRTPPFPCLRSLWHFFETSLCFGSWMLLVTPWASLSILHDRNKLHHESFSVLDILKFVIPASKHDSYTKPQQPSPAWFPNVSCFRLHS